MHRIWANDLPDNCIDDMEALHLEEEGPSPNLLFFVICCPFQSLKRLSRGKRRVEDLSVRWVRLRSGLQSIWNSKGKTEEFNIYKVWFYRLKGMLPLSKNIHSKKQTIDEALTYIKALTKALDIDISDVEFTSSSFT